MNSGVLFEKIIQKNISIYIEFSNIIFTFDMSVVDNGNPSPPKRGRPTKNYLNHENHYSISRNRS